MNHDIEEGLEGLTTIKKWSQVAESFQPVALASVDTARLQRQIEKLSAKLKNTRMQVVSEQPPAKTVQFARQDSEGATVAPYHTLAWQATDQRSGAPRYQNNRYQIPIKWE